VWGQLLTWAAGCSALDFDIFETDTRVAMDMVIDSLDLDESMH
jgi:hypothetical protein